MSEMPSASASPLRVPLGLPRPAALALLGLAVFLALAGAILTRGPKWLTDFDQNFYITIAYDLDRHGVFTNGVFDDVDSTLARPPPGMFFGPLYPTLIWGAMKLDPRFAQSVRCAVEANAGRHDGSACEVYARPMHVLHAALLAAGVLAIAFSAKLLLGSAAALPSAGVLAAAALLADAELFSFLMTESLSFALYSLTAAAMLAGWKTGRARAFAAGGAMLGLLCLTRPSFAILLPVFVALTIASPFVLRDAKAAPRWRAALLVGLAFAAVAGPWMGRNAVAAGKFGLTEEYGSAALIERFSFDAMTPREFALAFPYCLPVVGPSLVERLFGKDVMARFDWRSQDGFFQQGRARRVALVAAHGRLDPVIRDVAAAELKTNGWRYLLVALPLAWCGMWVGGVAAYLFVPAFALACARAAPPKRNALLLYSAPAFAMLLLHAAVANHYTRYNLILIGPFSVAGASMLSAFLSRFARTREECA